MTRDPLSESMRLTAESRELTRQLDVAMGCLIMTLVLQVVSLVVVISVIAIAVRSR